MGVCVPVCDKVCPLVRLRVCLSAHTLPLHTLCSLLREELHQLLPVSELSERVCRGGGECGRSSAVPADSPSPGPGLQAQVSLWISVAPFLPLPSSRLSGSHCDGVPAQGPRGSASLWVTVRLCVCPCVCTVWPHHTVCLQVPDAMSSHVCANNTPLAMSPYESLCAEVCLSDQGGLSICVAPLCDSSGHVCVHVRDPL